MRRLTNERLMVQSGMRWPLTTVLLACALVPVLFGCGGDEFDRIPVSGTVSYEGKPIPKGVVWFEPGPSLGNLATTGFATIENGSYRTAADESPVAGQHTVRIKGYDGTEPTEEDAREMMPGQVFLGQPLFPEFTRSVNLSKDSPTLDIDVDAP